MDTLLSPRRRTLLQALGATALLAGCGERPSIRGREGLHAFAGPTMGSFYTLKLFEPALGAQGAARAHEAVTAALADVERRMSAYDRDSELSWFNLHGAGAPFALSPDTLEVFALALEVSAATRGAFDVTVAPAVDAWGFGPPKGGGIPMPDELASLAQRVGYRQLEIDTSRGTLAKTRDDLRADLSGIAKGYGVDRAARALDDLGITNYMVEAGGEVRTRGRNAEGRPWQIAIERPDAAPGRAHYVVPLSGLSMATSGDYRIFFESEGRRYCHEIDPVTARPIENRVASVTVVAPECAYADAMATGLIVMGAERGLALAEQLDLAAYFILREADGRLTERQSAAFAALGGRPAARFL